MINPNTTEAMTKSIAAAAQSAAWAQTSVTAVNPSMGPASIESHYDEALSVPGILAEIRRAESEGTDGYVLACFGDPGLDAARELATGPVLGIAEAAMHTASHLGRGFSVVTTLERTAGRVWDLAERYGMSRFCRGVHGCDIAVLDLEQNPRTRDILVEHCRRAAHDDGSDVIVLGCAGMARLCRDISGEIGLPVIDGVTAAVNLVQSLVSMGLRKSGHGEFAAPPIKPYAGLLDSFGSVPAG
ncbi:hydantoin racemase [Mycobacteroides abscessus 5S-0422]|uniref:Hydantoin racemase n=1 Tax=Mycobacteroides abscessus subsp. bolletii 1513 TaxID=1299321 RepID=X8DV16_9MYCO|nr:hydantoin racemase [Mycobacteroides abscessus 5S-0421]EIU09696.1 hydantoin racemase [Mycobacteroides abscessus 5S-0304]EIU13103.1 hydantoin racemase [Mycobacteroides abscessus 5S-0422]EIU21745.1 hydantoin racemase [Mycobacteroides abscessus 5S-0708]EIU26624.1 hydantoin racemase [Mycobacteroides abscessus 5S-0817]EIU31676.1 hydantoin racemase [Mycobacteroides abscessus 5S-1212]EIU91585.1 hydantoin racemase [Mycobacteroides abscessus 5S-0921]EUA71380.1 asp/Glu/Hydantoin racemase family prot